MAASGRSRRVRDPHVDVIVVKRDRLHDLARAAQPDVQPDEELDGAGGPEAVDEVLGERAIDL
jgi:hypothetical protein